MSESASVPLFQLSAARLRLRDGSELALDDAEARGNRLALAGEWTPWFELLAGEAALVSGRAELAGVDVRQATARGVIGFAPLDPPLPARWKLRRYVLESAALVGRGRAFAKQSAAETIERFELGHLANRELGALRTAERRVLAIANAALAQPPIVVCERPLDRLDDAARAYVETALERALRGRLAVVSVADIDELGRERALLERFDALLVARGGSIEPRPISALGAEDARTLLVTVAANGGAFLRELSSRGVQARLVGRVDALLAFLPGFVDTTFERFRLQSADETARAVVVQASLASEAPIVELLSECAEKAHKG